MPISEAPAGARPAYPAGARRPQTHPTCHAPRGVPARLQSTLAAPWPVRGSRAQPRLRALALGPPPTSGTCAPQTPAPCTAPSLRSTPPPLDPARTCARRAPMRAVRCALWVCAARRASAGRPRSRVQIAAPHADPALLPFARAHPRPPPAPPCTGSHRPGFCARQQARTSPPFHDLTRPADPCATSPLGPSLGPAAAWGRAGARPSARRGEVAHELLLRHPH